MKPNQLFLVLILITTSTISNAAEKVWTGAGGSNWNTPANWQPAGVPTPNDDVLFNGAVSSVSCNLSSSTVVNNLSVTGNYIGTITAPDDAAAILTVQQLFELNSGTLQLGKCRLKVMDLFRVNGGSCVKGSSGITSLINLEINGGAFSIANGTVEILGNLSITGGSFTNGTGNFGLTGNYTQNGGSFSKSGGIGSFNSATTSSMSSGTFDCLSAAMSFKGFNVSGGTFNGGNTSIYFTGDLNLTNCAFNKNNGAIYINNNSALTMQQCNFALQNVILNAGNVSITGGVTNFGTGNILFTGTCTASSTQLTKASGDARISVGNTFTLTGSSLSFGNGLFNTGILNVSGSSLTIGTGAFNAEGNASFVNNSNFVKTGGSANIAYSNSVYSETSSFNLNNCSQVNLGVFTMTSGIFVSGNAPVLINGNLELNGNSDFTSSSATMNLKGNFRKIGGIFTHNSGTVIMDGTGAETYSILGFPSFNNLKITNTESSNPKIIEIYGNVDLAGILTLDNGSDIARLIRINNGVINVSRNCDITNYRNSSLNTGSGQIKFTGSVDQSIIGSLPTPNAAMLPKIVVEKTGGTFRFTGTDYNFGNGFRNTNSTIFANASMNFIMSGGSFEVIGFSIPKVIVSGNATLLTAMNVIDNLSLLAGGYLINNNETITVGGKLINNGRFQNYAGNTTISGQLENYGTFSSNSGAVVALSGILQGGGVFSGNTGTINITGNLNMNGGRFNCNNANVILNGNLFQIAGELNGNIAGGALTVNGNFLQTSGKFNSQNGQLNITGLLTLNGIFLRSNGTINFNASGPQTIPVIPYNVLMISGTGRSITLPPATILIGAETGGFNLNPGNTYTATNNTINYDRNGNQQIAGFAYENLTVSRQGIKALFANSSVKNVLTIGSSSTLDADGTTNNRVLTLLSTQQQTARIAQVPSTASIIGNMTVQRWTRGGIRSNRFLGIPVDSTGGIKYQQLRDNILVYGPGASGNGFDTFNGYSGNVNSYNETLPNTNEWEPPVTINSVIPTGKGINVYYLGNRTQLPFNAAVLPLPGTIDFKGVPNQGNKSLPVSCTGGCAEENNGNGWNLLSNPYASPIDWNSANWVRSGVSSTFYVWNPRTNQYATYNSQNPGAAINGGSQYIASGQSFFIKSTANTPLLNVTEGVKASQTPDTLLLRLSQPENQLLLSLNQPETETRDEIIVAFDPNAKEEYEERFDAFKPALPGTTADLSVLNEKGESLSVHTFKKPEGETFKKVIPVVIKAVSGNYFIEAEQLETFGSDVKFFLEDTYNRNYVALQKGDRYNFEVNEDPLSSGNKRMRLVITNERNAAVLTSAINVYPNPSNGNAVNVTIFEKSAGMLTVTDMLGSEVLRISNPANQQQIQLGNLSELSKGIYTLVWTSEGKRTTGRMTLN